MVKQKKVETIQEASLRLRAKNKGMIETMSNISIEKDTFDVFFGKGAKEVVRYLKKHPGELELYTRKGSTILLVSDGSSVSGIGVVGPHAILPLLESKAALLNKLGKVQVVPLPILTSDTNDFVHTLRTLSPSCVGILLYGISSPKCFEVMERMKRESDVPVLDATIHGFAPVVLAGLINAHAVARKDMRRSRVAILGAGATALSIAQVLQQYGVGDVVVVDRDGILGPLRTNLDGIKKLISLETNKEARVGGALEAITGADAVVSISASGPLTLEYVRMMAQRSIVFALRDPSPELSFADAVDSGALVCASRDVALPNYLSEALVLPYILRALCYKGSTVVNDTFPVLVGETLAHSVAKPTQKKIVPTIFERKHGKHLFETLR